VARQTLVTTLKAQRQFMSDASHQLRTPVSIVRTTAQVTLERPTRSEREYRESLTLVADQSARLARMVDGMFLLARAEAHGVPLQRELVNVDDLVGECARAVRVFADQRGVTVDVSGATELAFSGDDLLLRQMIGNLLDNAIRHANSAVTANVERATNAIVLRIADDGTGVPPAARDRIFERFVHLDADGRNAGGSGLGLPIARWIAEAHQGTLILEATGVTGSCFTVSLPCHRPFM
jgi:signal transduction histidine kinase